MCNQKEDGGKLDNIYLINTWHKSKELYKREHRFCCYYAIEIEIELLFNWMNGLKQILRIYI